MVIKHVYIHIYSYYNGCGDISSYGGWLSEGTRLPLGGVTAVPFGGWEVTVKRFKKV